MSVYCVHFINCCQLPYYDALSSMSSALCSMSSALCSMSSALCSMSSALCSMSSAPCSMSSALCPLFYCVAYRATVVYKSACISYLLGGSLTVAVNIISTISQTILVKLARLYAEVFIHMASYLPVASPRFQN